MRKRILGYMKKHRAGLKDLAGLLLIIAVGIFAYSNSFNCSFHFDDYFNIVNNLKIRDLYNIKAWWSFYPSRHVAIFSFALNYHFFGLEVWYWHLVNLVIHLVNALLVWWLVILVFSTPQIKDREIAVRKKLIAFFTALLFVSHPLATESVTYIVQRMTTLVTMFYLFSLIFYMKARLTSDRNIKKELFFALSFISAALAIYTKENAFTLPFTVCLVEIFFLSNGKESGRRRSIEAIVALTVFLIVGFLLLIKRSYHVFNTMPPMLGHTYTLTPVYYLLTQFSVIVKYIQLIFFPVNQILDYDFPVATHFFEVRTFLSFSILVSLFLLALLIYKKHRIISFGILWFFITLSVESSVIPILDVIFEHRTYLPSAGVFLAVCTALFSFRQKKDARPAIILLSLAVLVISYLTYERNKVWKDEISLWSDNVRKTPHHARPVAYLGSSYGLAGKWDKAFEYYSSAIRINPGYYYAYDGRGICYHRQRKYEKAIADYTRAIELLRGYSEGYNNRGMAYEDMGKQREALDDYNAAIRIRPDYRTAYYNRASLFRRSGQEEKALSDYNEAIRIDPGFTDAYIRRSLVFGIMGFPGKARLDFDQAVRLELMRRNQPK